MRRIIWIVLIVFLSACSQNNENAASIPKELEEEEVIETSEEEIENEEDEEKSDHLEEEDAEVAEWPEAKYEVTENWFIKPLHDDVNDEVVLLTIDDAPDKHALAMAKTLHELDAPAIFFVNGHLLESDESKEVLKEIHEMGFLIGNHTYSHNDLQSLSEEEQEEEIIRVSDMVEEIIGERPLFFRAPFGQNTDFSKQIVEEDNMVLMNWVYGYDWDAAYMTKDAIADIMVNANELANGANLLMHDREWTAEALEEIVLGLRNKGYETIDPALIKTKVN